MIIDTGHKIFDFTEGRNDLTILMDRIMENEEDTQKIIGQLCGVIISLGDRVEMLSKELYELAPDKEIIDTMYDDEEERLSAINRYMNHGKVVEP